MAIRKGATRGATTPWALLVPGTLVGDASADEVLAAEVTEFARFRRLVFRGLV